MYLIPLLITGAALACSTPTEPYANIGSSQIATANDSTGCSYPSQWFTQLLDHSGSSNATFQQKYQISTEHYKPGGPILLMQGEETATLYCLETTIFYDFVKELNGIAVILEHRYFGESLPFSVNLTDYTREQWSYLTLDNVMDDAVHFVDSLRMNTTDAYDAPVFAASGSYGGFLMNVFRQNRPQTFKGVIASSPPIRGFHGGNDTNVAGQFDWWNWVSTIWRDHSKEAADKIEEGFQVLADRFATNNISSLQDELNLCAPLPDNSTSTQSVLLSWLQDVFNDATEFDYNIVRPGWNPFAWPLQRITDIVFEQNDPIQVLNQSFWAWNGATAASLGFDYPCLNYSDVATQMRLNGPFEAVPFSYITCTYVMLSLYVGNDTIFLPTSNPGVENLEVAKQCFEEWGVPSLPSQDFYEKYHLTEKELQDSTGIIWSLGSHDSATALSGIYSFHLPSRGDPYASQRLFTTGMAHREDLFAWTQSTKDTVKATNEVELEIIKTWMSL